MRSPARRMTDPRDGAFISGRHCPRPPGGQRIHRRESNAIWVDAGPWQGVTSSEARKTDCHQGMLVSESLHEPVMDAGCGSDSDRCELRVGPRNPWGDAADAQLDGRSDRLPILRGRGPAPESGQSRTGDDAWCFSGSARWRSRMGGGAVWTRRAHRAGLWMGPGAASRAGCCREWCPTGRSASVARALAPRQRRWRPLTVRFGVPPPRAVRRVGWWAEGGSRGGVIPEMLPNLRPSGKGSSPLLDGGLSRSQKSP